MPYKDSLLRERVERRGTKAAERLEADRPQSVAERTQQQNPLMMDISGTSIIGLTLLENLTT